MYTCMLSNNSLTAKPEDLPPVTTNTYRSIWLCLFQSSSHPS